LAAGTRLGAYEVERSLGSGGMGQVYLARDTRLDRHIALKVVPPELAADPDRLARFAREAKTASSLNHPGIAHIYEIGEANGVHFIAMEYVRGEELRARIGRRGLPMSDVIIHATQIADALDEAHTHGIVHRDLKPSNVIVTPRGRIKVLDFGLAKMVGSPDRPDDGRSTRLTDAGLVLGTIDYMSPEQVRGISVDRRSDIFSFGVMLYEMITGRLPFAAESKTDLVYRIAQAQPDPLSRYTYDVPPELERIVRKCLEKEPSRRYQSARDLHVDLSGLKRDSSATMVAVAPQSRLASRTVRVAIMVALAAAAIGTPAAVYYWRAPDTIDSLAVLPDVSAADTAETVMVADVVANSVANSLSLTGSLRVAPRLRRAIAAGAVDPFAEARELGVHGALLVSAKVREGVATLDLRLVDVVHHPRQDWGQQYKLALSELDLAQQQIAAEVADTLNLRFDAEQRRALQVYQLFQRGHAQLSKRTARDLQRAIEFFELAIETDRSYARAWAGLAQAHNLLHIYSIVKPAEAAPAAKAAAEQALSLDARLAAAYTQRALVSFRWDWNWRQAEQEFARALTLDANDSNTRHWAAMFQTAAGQFDEAARLVLDAQAIAPLDPVVRSDLGWVLYMAGRYADAVTESERAIASRPDSHLAHWYLGVALMQLQQYGRAVQELETVVRMTNGQPNFRAELATVLAAAGRRSEAIRIREELLQAGRTSGFVPAYHIALIDAVLGDHNASLEWLEAAAREREGMLVWIGVEPRLGSLRQHPRFNAIAAKIRGDL
jgi:serine/threonine protein kinase/tetratricopeptide (TPR) repeat protein